VLSWTPSTTTFQRATTFRPRAEQLTTAGSSCARLARFLVKLFCDAFIRAVSRLIQDIKPLYCIAVIAVQQKEAQYGPDRSVVPGGHGRFDDLERLGGLNRSPAGTQGTNRRALRGAPTLVGVNTPPRSCNTDPRSVIFSSSPLSSSWPTFQTRPPDSRAGDLVGELVFHSLFIGG